MQIVRKVEEGKMIFLLCFFTYQLINKAVNMECNSQMGKQLEFNDCLLWVVKAAI